MITNAKQVVKVNKVIRLAITTTISNVNILTNNKIIVNQSIMHILVNELLLLLLLLLWVLYSDKFRNLWSER